jgi:serine O-acetyltransferase
MTVRTLLHRDALRYGSRPMTIRSLIMLALRHRGFRVMIFHRYSRRAHLAGYAVAAKVLHRMGYRLTQCEINTRAKIGPGLLLPHPAGVVIGAEVVIGANCTIQQHVTLGGNYGKVIVGRDKPTIGDDVAISCGAVVAGPVTIGNRTIIGANVVITRDVPAGSKLAASAPVWLAGPPSSDSSIGSSGQSNSDSNRP